MRRNCHHRSTFGFMGFNATPMVDVIFLLTIFFMLVTRFSSAEQIRMELPKPQKSRAQSAHIPKRVVINCRPADPIDPEGGGVLYSIGPNQPEALWTISDRLAEMKRASPGIQVVLRADKRLRYEHVRAVMRVIARHGVEMLNVVAHVDEEE